MLTNTVLNIIYSHEMYNFEMQDDDDEDEDMKIDKRRQLRLAILQNYKTQEKSHAL